MTRIKFFTLFLVIIFGMLSISKDSFAQMMDQNMMDFNNSETETEDSHGESLEVVLSELLTKYQVQTAQELDCGKIEDEEFESLGEAWMGIMHPNPETHEAMDNMMGGEGSDSLKKVHIQIGKNYLDCGNSQGSSCMMGPIMQGEDFMGNGIGWFGLHQLNWQFLRIMQTIIYILITILLLVMIRYFWKKGGSGATK